jgi:hypothetical protein
MFPPDFRLFTAREIGFQFGFFAAQYVMAMPVALI